VTCSVGGEEKTISGQVPARYVYEPGSDELECKIQKGSAGTLEVVLAAGNYARSEPAPREGTINLAYSSSGVSSSTLSSSG
jgi:hypothetical protein